MRRHGFTTLLDPFEQRFGKKSAALLYLPALTGEVFWTAAILTALGTTFGLILDLDTRGRSCSRRQSCLLYTYHRRALGRRHHRRGAALRPVIGLAVVVPFVAHEVGGFAHAWQAYQATVAAAAGAGQLVDVGRHGAAAGLRRHPVARVLPARPRARRRGDGGRLSILAGLLCMVAAVPPALIGFSRAARTGHARGLAAPDATLVLPYVLKTPDAAVRRGDRSRRRVGGRDVVDRRVGALGVLDGGVERVPSARRARRQLRASHLGRQARRSSSSATAATLMALTSAASTPSGCSAAIWSTASCSRSCCSR